MLTKVSRTFFPVIRFSIFWIFFEVNVVWSINPVSKHITQQLLFEQFPFLEMVPDFATISVMKVTRNSIFFRIFFYYHIRHSWSFCIYIFIVHILALKVIV